MLTFIANLDKTKRASEKRAALCKKNTWHPRNASVGRLGFLSNLLAAEGKTPTRNENPSRIAYVQSYLKAKSMVKPRVLLTSKEVKCEL